MPGYCPNCSSPLPEERVDGLCFKCVAEQMLPDFSDQPVDGQGNGTGSHSELPGNSNVTASSSVTGTTRGRFGDYELLERLGQGGMGVVYSARHLRLGVIRALKRILHADIATPRELERLRLEAETGAHFRHPNIVPIHEFGEVDGEYYFTMDLIEGKNLAQKIARKEFALPESRDHGNRKKARETQERIAKLIATVAHAVHHAHQCGFLHRDLSPSNILVDAEGQPYVTDFGVAKAFNPSLHAVSSSGVIGKADYMAPEQATGQEVGRATDIWGIGAILYELLTGRPPFRGATPVETLRQVTDETPCHPCSFSKWVDKTLASICLSCLEKDPRHRYATAQGLAEDLERWLRDEPVELLKPSLGIRTYRWIQRNPVGAALIVVLLAGLTASLIFLELAIQNKRAADKARQAEQAAREREIGARQAALDAQKRILDLFIASDFWILSNASVSIPHRILDSVTGTKPDADSKIGKIYTVGILAEEKPVDTVYGYAQLLGYLEKCLNAHKSTNGIHIGLRVFKRNEDAMEGLLKGEVEIMKIGGLSYLIGKKLDPSVYPLVSQHPQKKGVIFASQESGITNRTKLEGKRFAFGDTNATISKWAAYYLVEAGISATNLKHFAYLDAISMVRTNPDWPKHFVHLSSHALVIPLVMSNLFDAGVTTLKTFEQSGQTNKLIVLKSFESDPVFWVANTNLSPEVAEILRVSLSALQDKSIFQTFSDRITSYQRAGDQDLNRLREALETVEKHGYFEPCKCESCAKLAVAEKAKLGTGDKYEQTK